MCYKYNMRSIGIRELRQNASVHLREVEAGETITVTDRGRPIAQLVPIRPQSARERLIAEGRLKPGKGGNILDIERAKPKPGIPLPSEILAQMRDAERF
jgi:prevent-host-death family protein